MSTSSAHALPPNGVAKVYDQWGKTSIPDEVRSAMGWGEGDELQFIVDDGFVRIVEVEDE